eukprot:symbB.v1.2.019799.t1/scaffold1636.1/size108148/4
MVSVRAVRKVNVKMTRRSLRWLFIVLQWQLDAMPPARRAILKKMILRLSDVFVWLCEASQKAIESNLSPGNGQLCFPGRGAPGSKAARRATPPS